MAECKKILAAVFDLDGTLCCTSEDLLAAVNDTLLQLGFPLQDSRSILLHINEGGREFIRKSLPRPYWEDSSVCDRAMALYCDYYDKHPCDHTYVYPGVYESLSALKKAGVKLACFTNKPHGQALNVLGRVFPSDFFEIILGAGTFPMKPDPSGVLWILSKFGVESENAVYFGDSDLDMQTAKRAGMRAVGVSWGYRSEAFLREAGADMICNTGDDIVRFCS